MFTLAHRNGGGGGGGGGGTDYHSVMSFAASCQCRMLRC